MSICAADVSATPVTTSPSERIERPTLQKMYQRELGKHYNPADADQIYHAHQLLEDFFDAKTAEQRKAITKSVEDTGVDPNILGRLCRIRMDWPNLGGGIYYINEQFGQVKVNYFLGIPEKYDRAIPWPLVIKLPAAVDPFLAKPPLPPPTAEKVAEIYTKWMTEELEAHPDAIVIMPRLNLDELYGPSYAGMNSVIQPLQHAFNRVNLDPARVYMVGHGWAAHAVWNLSLHYTNYFASFCALAGGAGQDWQRVRLINLRNVLPVVWHDADDLVQKVDLSRSLVRLLRGKKIDVEYEETKGLGHAPSDDVYQRCYEKMRARTRELYPQQVWLESTRPDTLFNRMDWVQVYQTLTPGAERRVLLRHGTGHMLLNENPYRIDAVRKSQRLDVTTDNVESMRFYFNDQTLDFSKPLTIVVNKKGRFEDLVKMSVDEMLKDQLFLGRGWRYFTGKVDIDFGAPSSGATSPATTQSTTRKGKIEIVRPATQPE
ncbi:MAG TPA: hypothetical protein VIL86_17130 [Tepidisphaeraceae bacterium]